MEMMLTSAEKEVFFQDREILREVSIKLGCKPEDVIQRCQSIIDDILRMKAELHQLRP